jgi:DNA-binding PadR family transcriptional regulator
MAQQAHREQAGGSPLRGVLLALLLGEPGQALHGYRLATLLRRRLGPAWDVERQSVYRVLSKLEEEGLLRRADAASDAKGGGRGRRSYRATQDAEAAVARWMEAPVSKELIRSELQAKIAVSRAHDAPRLLQALDAYERSCFGILRESEEAKVPMGSWAGVAANLRRAAVDEGIHADLRWIAKARKWIQDYLVEHGEQTPR